MKKRKNKTACVWKRVVMKYERMEEI